MHHASGLISLKGTILMVITVVRLVKSTVYHPIGLLWLNQNESLAPDYLGEEVIHRIEMHLGYALLSEP